MLANLKWAGKENLLYFAGFCGIASIFHAKAVARAARCVYNREHKLVKYSMLQIAALYIGFPQLQRGIPGSGKRRIMGKIQVDFSPVAGKTLLVALSGGADSVALVALLRAWGGCRLMAAHFEHGIRGEASRSDADFCRSLCAEWNVPYFEERADVPAEAALRGQGIETTARELRYAFLRRVCAENAADCIALAHHMDDQAETVLMHLLRGAGVSGMAGMRAFAGDLYRPLLGVRKQALVDYLTEHNIPWREDATNQFEDTPRNRLRLTAIPALERVYPAAVQAIARQAELTAAEDDFMRDAAEKWLETALSRGPYGLLVNLNPLPHPAIFRRGVRLALGRPLEFETVEAIRKVAYAPNTRARIQLPGGSTAERIESRLYLLPERKSAPQPVPLSLDGTTRMEGICEIQSKPWTGEPLRENSLVQTLDRSALSGAVLRTRLAGDRIRPFGLAGEKLLSDYLTDRRIDRPLRDVLPIVARGSQVLWVAGVGIADAAALHPGRAGVRLEVLYQGFSLE